MPKKPEVIRQRRFEKPVEVRFLSRGKGTPLFAGECDGVNDNGLGANVRAAASEVPPPVVGDVYRVLFHVPVEIGEPPLARVIRIDPPRGEPGLGPWEVYLALRFETAFDSGRLFAAAAPRRPGAPPPTSIEAARLDALLRSRRRPPPAG
jgi:hypothetical protein